MDPEDARLWNYGTEQFLNNNVRPGRLLFKRDEPCPIARDGLLELIAFKGAVETFFIETDADN
jgi:hypothetical protein